MWYLLSVIYALPIYYFTLKYIPDMFYTPIIAVLYIIKSVSNVYLEWMSGSVQEIFGLLEKMRMSGLREAIIVIIPYLLTGRQVKKQRLTMRISAFGLICSMALLFFESFVCRKYGQESVCYAVFRLPASFFLFQFILNIQIKRPTKMLRDMSIWIYCIHPIFIEILSKHYQIHSLVLYLVVVLFSISSSVLLMKSLERKRVPM